MSNNGKQGERLFYQQMDQQGYFIQNVSHIPEYYYRGDFVVVSPTTGQRKIFEVKWDTRISTTGNLYLETMSINSKDKKGWWKFCQADYIAYGDAVNRKFYIIPLAQLKERVKQLPTRWAQCGDESEGLLVSLKDIADIAQIL